MSEKNNGQQPQQQPAQQQPAPAQQQPQPQPAPAQPKPKFPASRADVRFNYAHYQSYVGDCREQNPDLTLEQMLEHEREDMEPVDPAYVDTVNFMLQDYENKEKGVHFGRLKKLKPETVEKRKKLVEQCREAHTRFHWYHGPGSELPNDASTRYVHTDMMDPPMPEDSPQVREQKLRRIQKISDALYHPHKFGSQMTLVMEHREMLGRIGELHPEELLLSIKTDQDLVDHFEEIRFLGSMSAQNEDVRKLLSNSGISDPECEKMLDQWENTIALARGMDTKLQSLPTEGYSQLDFDAMSPRDRLQLELEGLHAFEDPGTIQFPQNLPGVDDGKKAYKFLDATTAMMQFDLHAQMQGLAALADQMEIPTENFVFADPKDPKKTIPAFWPGKTPRPDVLAIAQELLRAGKMVIFDKTDPTVKIELTPDKRNASKALMVENVFSRPPLPKPTANASKAEKERYERVQKILKDPELIKMRKQWAPEMSLREKRLEKRLAALNINIAEVRSKAAAAGLGFCEYAHNMLLARRIDNKIAENIRKNEKALEDEIKRMQFAHNFVEANASLNYIYGATRTERQVWEEGYVVSSAENRKLAKQNIPLDGMKLDGTAMTDDLFAGMSMLLAHSDGFFAQRGVDKDGNPLPETAGTIGLIPDTGGFGLYPSLESMPFVMDGANNARQALAKALKGGEMTPELAQQLVQGLDRLAKQAINWNFNDRSAGAMMNFIGKTYERLVGIPGMTAKLAAAGLTVETHKTLNVLRTLGDLQRKRSIAEAELLDPVLLNQREVEDYKRDILRAGIAMEFMRQAREKHQNDLDNLARSSPEADKTRLQQELSTIPMKFPALLIEYADGYPNVDPKIANIIETRVEAGMADFNRWSFTEQADILNVMKPEFFNNRVLLEQDEDPERLLGPDGESSARADLLYRQSWVRGRRDEVLYTTDYLASMTLSVQPESLGDRISYLSADDAAWLLAEKIVKHKLEKLDREDDPEIAFFRPFTRKPQDFKQFCDLLHTFCMEQEVCKKDAFLPEELEFDDPALLEELANRFTNESANYREKLTAYQKEKSALNQQMLKDETTRKSLLTPEELAYEELSAGEDSLEKYWQNCINIYGSQVNRGGTEKRELNTMQRHCVTPESEFESDLPQRQVVSVAVLAMLDVDNGRLISTDPKDIRKRRDTLFKDDPEGVKLINRYEVSAHVLQDVAVMRAKTETLLGEDIRDARGRMKEVLTAFDNGDVEPLARLIAANAPAFARLSSISDDTTAIPAKLTMQMQVCGNLYSLMEARPDLREAAMQHGLTEQDLQLMRAQKNICALREKSIAAKKKLASMDPAAMDTMDNEEVKGLLADCMMEQSALRIMRNMVALRDDKANKIADQYRATLQASHPDKPLDPTEESDVMRYAVCAAEQTFELPDELLDLSDPEKVEDMRSSIMYDDEINSLIDDPSSVEKMRSELLGIDKQRELTAQVVERAVNAGTLEQARSKQLAGLAALEQKLELDQKDMRDIHGAVVPQFVDGPEEKMQVGKAPKNCKQLYQEMLHGYGPQADIPVPAGFDGNEIILLNMLTPLSMDTTERIVTLDGTYAGEKGEFLYKNDHDSWYAGFFVTSTTLTEDIVNRRPGSVEVFMKGIALPARHKLRDAMNAYSEGDMEPLGRVIGENAGYLVNSLINAGNGKLESRQALAMSVGKGLYQMLRDHPELEAAARQYGLTDTAVQSMELLDRFRDSFDARLNAQKQALGDRQPEGQELWDCLTTLATGQLGERLCKEQKNRVSAQVTSYITAEVERLKLNDAKSEAERLLKGNLLSAVSSSAQHRGELMVEPSEDLRRMLDPELQQKLAERLQKSRKIKEILKYNNLRDLMMGKPIKAGPGKQPFKEKNFIELLEQYSMDVLRQCKAPEVGDPAKKLAEAAERLGVTKEALTEEAQKAGVSVSILIDRKTMERLDSERTEKRAKQVQAARDRGMELKQAMAEAAAADRTLDGHFDDLISETRRRMGLTPEQFEAMAQKQKLRPNALSKKLDDQYLADAKKRTHATEQRFTELGERGFTPPEIAEQLNAEYIRMTCSALGVSQEAFEQLQQTQKLDPIKAAEQLEQDYAKNICRSFGIDPKVLEQDAAQQSKRLLEVALEAEQMFTRLMNESLRTELQQDVADLTMNSAPGSGADAMSAMLGLGMAQMIEAIENGAEDGPDMRKLKEPGNSMLDLLVLYGRAKRSPELAETIRRQSIGPLADSVHAEPGMADCRKHLTVAKLRSIVATGRYDLLADLSKVRPMSKSMYRAKLSNASNLSDPKFDVVPARAAGLSRDSRGRYQSYVKELAKQLPDLTLEELVEHERNDLRPPEPGVVEAANALFEKIEELNPGTKLGRLPKLSRAEAQKRRQMVQDYREAYVRELWPREAGGLPDGDYTRYAAQHMMEPPLPEDDEMTRIRKQRRNLDIRDSLKYTGVFGNRQKAIQYHREMLSKIPVMNPEEILLSIKTDEDIVSNYQDVSYLEAMVSQVQNIRNDLSARGIFDPESEKIMREWESTISLAQGLNSYMASFGADGTAELDFSRMTNRERLELYVHNFDITGAIEDGNAANPQNGLPPIKWKDPTSNAIDAYANSTGFLVQSWVVGNVDILTDMGAARENLVFGDPSKPGEAQRFTGDSARAISEALLKDGKAVIFDKTNPTRRVDLTPDKIDGSKALMIENIFSRPPMIKPADDAPQAEKDRYARVQKILKDPEYIKLRKLWAPEMKLREKGLEQQLNAAGMNVEQVRAQAREHDMGFMQYAHKLVTAREVDQIEARRAAQEQQRLSAERVKNRKAMPVEAKKLGSARNFQNALETLTYVYGAQRAERNSWQNIITRQEKAQLAQQAIPMENLRLDGSPISNDLFAGLSMMLAHSDELFEKRSDGRARPLPETVGTLDLVPNENDYGTRPKNNTVPFILNGANNARKALEQELRTGNLSPEMARQLAQGLTRLSQMAVNWDPQDYASSAVMDFIGQSYRELSRIPGAIQKLADAGLTEETQLDLQTMMMLGEVMRHRTEAVSALLNPDALTPQAKEKYKSDILRAGIMTEFLRQSKERRSELIAETVKTAPPLAQERIKAELEKIPGNFPVLLRNNMAGDPNAVYVLNERVKAGLAEFNEQYFTDPSDIIRVMQPDFFKDRVMLSDAENPEFNLGVPEEQKTLIAQKYEPLLKQAQQLAAQQAQQEQPAPQQPKPAPQQAQPAPQQAQPAPQQAQPALKFPDPFEHYGRASQDKYATWYLFQSRKMNPGLTLEQMVEHEKNDFAVVDPDVYKSVNALFEHVEKQHPGISFGRLKKTDAATMEKRRQMAGKYREGYVRFNWTHRGLPDDGDTRYGHTDLMDAPQPEDSEPLRAQKMRENLEISEALHNPRVFSNQEKLVRYHRRMLNRLPEMHPEEYLLLVKSVSDVGEYYDEFRYLQSMVTQVENIQRDLQARGVIDPGCEKIMREWQGTVSMADGLYSSAAVLGTDAVVQVDFSGLTNREKLTHFLYGDELSDAIEDRVMAHPKNMPSITFHDPVEFTLSGYKSGIDFEIQTMLGAIPDMMKNMGVSKENIVFGNPRRPKEAQQFSIDTTNALAEAMLKNGSVELFDKNDPTKRIHLTPEKMNVSKAMMVENVFSRPPLPKPARNAPKAERERYERVQKILNDPELINLRKLWEPEMKLRERGLEQQIKAAGMDVAEIRARAEVEGLGFMQYAHRLLVSREVDQMQAQRVAEERSRNTAAMPTEAKKRYGALQFTAAHTTLSYIYGAQRAEYGGWLNGKFIDKTQSDKLVSQKIALDGVTLDQTPVTNELFAGMSLLLAHSDARFAQRGTGADGQPLPETAASTGLIPDAGGFGYYPDKSSMPFIMDGANNARQALAEALKGGQMTPELAAELAQGLNRLSGQAAGWDLNDRAACAMMDYVSRAYESLCALPGVREKLQNAGMTPETRQNLQVMSKLSELTRKRSVAESELLEPDGLSAQQIADYKKDILRAGIVSELVRQSNAKRAALLGETVKSAPTEQTDAMRKELELLPKNFARLFADYADGNLAAEKLIEDRVTIGMTDFDARHFTDPSDIINVMQPDFFKDRALLTQEEGPERLIGVPEEDRKLVDRTYRQSWSKRRSEGLRFIGDFTQAKANGARRKLPQEGSGKLTPDEAAWVLTNRIVQRKLERLDSADDPEIAFFVGAGTDREVWTEYCEQVHLFCMEQGVCKQGEYSLAQITDGLVDPFGVDDLADRFMADREKYKKQYDDLKKVLVAANREKINEESRIANSRTPVQVIVDRLDSHRKNIDGIWAHCENVYGAQVDHMGVEENELRIQRLCVSPDSEYELPQGVSKRQAVTLSVLAMIRENRGRAEKEFNADFSIYSEEERQRFAQMLIMPHIVQDVGMLRAATSEKLGPMIRNVRMDMKNAMAAYADGDVGPLAQIIAETAGSFARNAAVDESGGKIGDTAYVQLEIAGHLSDLLDGDEELMNAVMQKGLKPEELQLLHAEKTSAELIRKAEEAKRRLATEDTDAMTDEELKGLMADCLMGQMCRDIQAECLKRRESASRKYAKDIEKRIQATHPDKPLTEKEQKVDALQSGIYQSYWTMRYPAAFLNLGDGKAVGQMRQQLIDGNLAGVFRDPMTVESLQAELVNGPKERPYSKQALDQVLDIDTQDKVAQRQKELDEMTQERADNMQDMHEIHGARIGEFVAKPNEEKRLRIAGVNNKERYQNMVHEFGEEADIPVPEGFTEKDIVALNLLSPLSVDTIQWTGAVIEKRARGRGDYRQDLFEAGDWIDPWYDGLAGTHTALIEDIANRRPYSTELYMKGVVLPARRVLRDAMSAYANQNIEPLAELIGRNLGAYVNMTVHTESGKVSARQALAPDTLKGLYALLQNHPELEQAARKYGLTDATMQSLAVYDKLSDEFGDRLKAQQQALSNQQPEGDELLDCVSELAMDALIEEAFTKEQQRTSEAAKQAKEEELKRLKDVPIPKSLTDDPTVQKPRDHAEFNVQTSMERRTYVRLEPSEQFRKLADPELKQRLAENVRKSRKLKEVLKNNSLKDLMMGKPIKTAPGKKPIKEKTFAELLSSLGLAALKQCSVPEKHQRNLDGKLMEATEQLGISKEELEKEAGKAKIGVSDLIDRKIGEKIDRERAEQRKKAFEPAKKLGITKVRMLQDALKNNCSVEQQGRNYEEMIRNAQTFGKMSSEVLEQQAKEQKLSLVDMAAKINDQYVTDTAKRLGVDKERLLEQAKTQKMSPEHMAYSANVHYIEHACRMAGVTPAVFEKTANDRGMDMLEYAEMRNERIFDRTCRRNGVTREQMLAMAKEQKTDLINVSEKLDADYFENTVKTFDLTPEELMNRAEAQNLSPTEAADQVVKSYLQDLCNVAKSSYQHTVNSTVNIPDYADKPNTRTLLEGSAQVYELLVQAVMEGSENSPLMKQIKQDNGVMLDMLVASDTIMGARKDGHISMMERFVEKKGGITDMLKQIHEEPFMVEARKNLTVGKLRSLLLAPYGGLRRKFQNLKETTALELAKDGYQINKGVRQQMRVNEVARQQAVNGPKEPQQQAPQQPKEPEPPKKEAPKKEMGNMGKLKI